MPVTDYGVSTYTTSADMSTAAAIAPAPGAGAYSQLLEVTISVGSAIEVSLQEETSATVLFSFLMAANTTLNFKPSHGNELPTANKRWMGKASGAGQIRITTVTAVV